LPILKGTSYAILGPNGSGKSTFTLMLTGQVSPTEGQLLWKNDDAIIPEKQWNQFYSLSSPALELPEEFTIEEWFQYHQKLKPFVEKFSLNELIEVCEFPNKIKNKPLMYYSSGMKQRIKLCLSFFGNQPLSILDEPLTNLDKQGIDLYQNLVNKFQSEKCIIVASNREDEIYFCQQKLTISKEQQSLNFQQ
jgi:ABC-type multidrug transport system ATPase subunit